MHEWMNWLIISGLVVVVELFSGTFYLLMVALGCAAGGMVAFGGGQLALQLIVAAGVGATATVMLRRSRFGGGQKVIANRDPNVNLDIGQLIQINEWHRVSAERQIARAMYRGAMWDVEFLGVKTVEPGMFTIVEIQGSQLIVQPPQ